jgi:type II secretory ATPase GspE/PulE/Tfp pilus assembly ATPase PilB-like protein
MPSDRTFMRRAAAVTVALIEGRSLAGELTRFSPMSADLTLASGASSAPKTTIPAERIAYVAFHRSDADPPASPNSKRGTVKVTVAGGATFHIASAEPEAPGPTGFYALPADAQSPFREIFFYHHGVKRRELDEPIGELLVLDGRVDRPSLIKGLKAQSEQQRTPIGQILIEHKRIDQASLERATDLQKRRGTRLGEVLIEAGLATVQDVEFALAEQRQRGGKRIGQILVEMKLVSETDLARTLAKKFHLPFVDLDTCVVNGAAIPELPRDFIRKHQLLPLESDTRTLTVAIGDPLAIDTIDAARMHSGKQILEVVVVPSQLEKHISTRLADLAPEKVTTEVDTILKGLAADEIRAVAESEPEASSLNESDNAIIKLANQMVIDAYKRGASDIHIEPNGRDRATVIRFRIDGDCVAYQEVPSTYRMPLVARFKIMATLDIAERRKPQDGKIRFRFGDQAIELRVATIPTVNNNEDIVLRILAAQKPLPLESMNMSTRNLTELRKLIEKPYGLILCVGPTGSGKTTTLHSALGAINTVDLKIWTAEDPVEITQAGLRQVQVNPKIGFTFAHAMRSFLRADPDVIMVGEMRDEETAGTAIEASLTGHLVFSTLHTNSAPETVTRLIDMGLDPFSFADALLGVLAQRLARTLCKQCRQPYTADEAEVQELRTAYGAARFQELVQPREAGGLKLWRAAGCSACGGSGYKGRTALHELLVADDALKRAIQKKAPVDDIRAIAGNGGMQTLLQDGVEKVLSGQTDLKQVLAVCSR